jgi:hypothetical protein
MARIRAIRSLLAALLLVGQFASVFFLAEAAARGAYCPVHQSLARHDASAHHSHDSHHIPHSAGHKSGHKFPGDREDNAASPHISFVCCAGCIAALTAIDPWLPAPQWIAKPPFRTARGLKPGELPSADPPPRILL